MLSVEKSRKVGGDMVVVESNVETHFSGFSVVGTALLTLAPA